MGGYKNRLKQMQESWDNNREFEPDVPDGKYTMQLQDATLAPSQSSNKLQIAREHLVLEGEHEGQVARDFLQLETEKGPRFIGLWIEQMGYEVPEDITELEEVVAAIAEAAPTYTAQVKISDGGFTNIRVLAVIDEGEASSANDDDADGTEGGEDDPIEGEDTGKEPGGEDELTELLAFAQSQEIDVDDGDDLDSVTEKVLEFEWDRTELIDEEVELLESIGAEFVTKKTARPGPKPTPKKKVVTKKPSGKKPKLKRR